MRILNFQDFGDFGDFDDFDDFLTEINEITSRSARQISLKIKLSAYFLYFRNQKLYLDYLNRNSRK